MEYLKIKNQKFIDIYNKKHISVKDLKNDFSWSQINSMVEAGLFEDVKKEHINLIDDFAPSVLSGGRSDDLSMLLDFLDFLKGDSRTQEPKSFANIVTHLSVDKSKWIINKIDEFDLNEIFIKDDVLYINIQSMHENFKYSIKVSNCVSWCFRSGNFKEYPSSFDQSVKYSKNLDINYIYETFKKFNYKY